MFHHHTKKFYNIDTPEQVSSPAANPVLEAMAKHGVMTQADSAVELQPINIEPQEPPKETGSEPPAVSATDTPTVDLTTPETQTEPVKAEEPAAPAPIEPPQVQPPSLEEVLKQQQPDTVLKALGYDEPLVKVLDAIKSEPKMLAFFQHWANNGDTTTYLREANIDYTKMPAEEVMRHQLRAEYPGMSERHLQVLFEDEVLDRYKLDADKYSEEEVERGRLLLEARAEKYRGQLIENQKNFLLPKPPEPKADVPDNSEELRRQTEFNEYKSAITDNAYTKNLFAQKALTVGEGEEKFNFPVNPQELTDILLNTDKWAESFFNIEEKPNGDKKYIPDVEKQLLVAAVTKYGKKFFTEYANHLKSLGAKAAIEPIENAKIPDQSQPSAPENQATNPAAAMAKGGRLISGGY